MRKLLHAYLRSPGQFAQFLRFATVGVKISAIDIGGVYLLPWLFEMNFYLARVISLSTALFVGYLLNRHFTFASVRREGGFYRQLAGHFGVHLTGGALNYGVFILVLRAGHGAVSVGNETSLLPLIGLWLGGVVGMTFNYFAARTFVFRPAATPEKWNEDELEPEFGLVSAERDG